MIIGYYDVQAGADKLRDVLSREESLSLTRSWSRFVELAPGASGCIVWLHRLDAPTALALRSFREENRSTPTILITRLDSASARLLLQVPVHEVIWDDEVDAELTRAVSLLTERRAKKLFCDGLAGLGLPKRAHDLMLLALNDSPPSSVGEWAKRSGRTHSSLWRVWRQHIDELSPMDFLDIVHAVSALDILMAGGTMKRAAIELRLSRRSLSRKFARRFGACPQELRVGTPQSAINQAIQLVRVAGETALARPAA